MTERLYYTDSYTTRFTAQITERLTVRGTPAVVLNRSYFYPESGGQPADAGQLGGVRLRDVQVREEDNAVLHLLDDDVEGDEVTGVIDWSRRFDHMQHHTGQHILTQAFIQVADAPTVSFHLGAEVVTIDLASTDLTPAEVDAVEALANDLITQNVPVRAWFPSAEELDILPIRKMPDISGSLRVVGIGDFDATACGGTHVTRTGEIGLIKIIRTEKYKDMTRVSFLCGARALQDYREKNAILLRLAADLTTGYREIGESLAKLRAENRQLRTALKDANARLLVADAQDLLAAAPMVDGLRIVVAVLDADRDPAGLRPLASLLVASPGTVALLGLAGEKAQLIMARAADLPGLDMVPLLRETIGALTGEPDSRRGGGRPEFAQGGGFPADGDALRAALEDVAGRL